MLDLENKINKDKIANETFAVSRFLDNYFGLIVMVMILMIVIFSFAFVLQPRMDLAVAKVNDVQNTMKDEMSSLEKYKKQLVSYKEAYNSVPDLDKKKISDIIGPANKYSSIYRSDLLISYNNLMQKNGFTLDKINVGEISAGDNSSRKIGQTAPQANSLPAGVAEMQVELAVSNLNYERFKQLLSILENESRIADLVSFDCDAGMAKCSFKLDTYYFTTMEGAESAK